MLLVCIFDETRGSLLKKIKHYSMWDYGRIGLDLLVRSVCHSIDRQTQKSPLSEQRSDEVRVSLHNAGDITVDGELSLSP